MRLANHGPLQGVQGLLGQVYSETVKGVPGSVLLDDEGPTRDVETCIGRWL